MPTATPASLTDAPDDFYQRHQRLVDAFHPHLASARMRLQVRPQARNNQDLSVTWAETDTANDDQEKKEFDFTTWFALDIWATLSELQRDALMDHELTHCTFDEQGQPLLIGHDIDEFYAIIGRYGLWWPGAQHLAEALSQMPAATG